MAGPLSAARMPRSNITVSCSARTSFAGNLLNSLIIATRRRRSRSRRVRSRRPMPSRASGFARGGVLMTGFLVINMFPVVLLIIPLFVLMKQLGAPRHLPGCHPRPFDLRDSLRDLDADELLQRHPAGARRSGDDRRRDAARSDPPDHPAARRCRASSRRASISSSPPGTSTSSP